MITCEFCKKEFSSKCVMVRHQATTKQCVEIQLTNGKEVQTKEYKCTNISCTKTYNSNTALKYHLERCTKQENKSSENDATLLQKINLLEKIIKQKDELILQLQTQLQKTKKREPVKHVRKIDSNVSKLAWSKWIGEDIARHKCLCCNSRWISQFDFECGHVQAVAEGGDDSIDNIRPICKSCNVGMKTINMMEYIKHHKFDVVK